jgi:hypothetical protein
MKDFYKGNYKTVKNEIVEYNGKTSHVHGSK